MMFLWWGYSEHSMNYFKIIKLIQFSETDNKNSYLVSGVIEVPKPNQFKGVRMKNPVT